MVGWYILLIATSILLLILSEPIWISFAFDDGLIFSVDFVFSGIIFKSSGKNKAEEKTSNQKKKRKKFRQRLLPVLHAVRFLCERASFHLHGLDYPLPGKEPMVLVRQFGISHAVFSALVAVADSVFYSTEVDGRSVRFSPCLSDRDTPRFHTTLVVAGFDVFAALLLFLIDSIKQKERGERIWRKAK